VVKGIVQIALCISVQSFPDKAVAECLLIKI